MHLKEDIYKNWIFHQKNGKVIHFLSITLFRHFFTNLRMIFGTPTKLRIFVYPCRSIFIEKKNLLTLFRGFCYFFEDKNRHYYAQNREKCLFYFGLRILTLIQSYTGTGIPLSWILKKVKIWPTLLYTVL